MSSDHARYARERAVAIEAAREAARLCVRVQRSRVLGAPLVKGDRSPVTVADFGSQALVCRRLVREFPGDSIMGEEDASELRRRDRTAIADAVRVEVAREVPGSSREEVLDWIDRAGCAGGLGRFWALDPIDGTKGFLRGEQYAVALALLDGGEVQLGALACPNLRSSGSSGCILVAVRGGGAELLPLEGGPPSRARASPADDPRTARILESVEAAHGDLAANERIRRRLGVATAGVRLDSQAKYAVLARGDAEIYLRLPSSADYRENVWDHAAGAVVIEEAGGRVTDVDGRPLDFGAGRKLVRNRGIVASNGRLHEPFLAALRELRDGIA